MRLTLLVLLIGLFALIVHGHIIDGNGNCIADCHEEEVEQLTSTGPNHAVVNMTL